jgi:tetratricopeptide (TPR) repeat protein
MAGSRRICDDRRRFVRFVSAAFLAGAVALTGCASKQRGLNYIREEGDREYSRGNFNTALADYQEYVQRNPGDPDVRHSLAKTLLKTGDPAAAVEHASIALDARPDNEQYLETLAESLYQSKQTDALYRLPRTNASDRGRVGDYIRLGHYAAKLGDADGAEQVSVRRQDRRR